ncbi:MAG: tetratricopeptide repeat protein [Alphaproteobacteria bacterium]|nr:tetratricopeptide repeat protein [Alphaproteobacteria bacterium]
MRTYELVLPQDIYAEYLENVNNIKFTRREIDTIAYLLSGRSAKTISSFLSIAPKTIETHMRNIMLKLECNSRDGIIDFIEKSDKLSFIKTHYLSLLTQSSFEKRLLKISELIGDKGPSCLIVYWKEPSYKTNFIRHLANHLKYAGIKATLEIRERHNFTTDPLNDVDLWQANYVLYPIPDVLLRQLHEGNHEIQLEFSHFIQRIKKNSNCLILLFPNEGRIKNILKDVNEIESIDFSEGRNYYFFVFKILKKLLPHIDFEEIIHDFKSQNEATYGSFDKLYLPVPPEKKRVELDNFIEKTSVFINKLLTLIKIRKNLFLTLFFLCLIAFGIWLFATTDNKGSKLTQNNASQEVSSVRSDLIVPTQSILLDRSQLMAQIEDRLNGDSPIHTIALVGIGGAGKTTVARNYARQQKTPIVWELNAETKETLNDSFENLADALSKTEEEKKKLRELKDIKIAKERQKNIILLVKEKLKKFSSWFLIYDNVEKIANIQEYFPHDANVWGKGRVIIITRDKNIENSNYIDNTIQIGELNAKEKLDLFMRIKKNGTSDSYTSLQIKQAEAFLQEIPPFPLDVSVAAYYLKTTQVPYEKYLEHLKEYNKDFATVQENVLKEATNYTKTRYKIITLSLKHLIDSHKDFGDLLLFISLLDSHIIPRDLLNTFKNDVIVENFIYNLKKYSFITQETSTSSHLPAAFSIHQSTQGIILEYITNTRLLEQNKHLLGSIFNTIEKYIDGATEGEDISRIKLLVKHCEMFIQHRNLINNVMMAAVEGKLGYIYYYLSDYKKAKILLEQSLLDLNGYESENQARVAHTLMYLGDVYSELRDHEKAKRLCEQSLTIYKKHFSENHIGIARALAYLGNVNRRLGHYQKAKELCEQSLRIYQQNFSQNPTRVSWVLAHLGIALRELGDLEQARTLLEQSLAIYKQQTSESHARVAWVSGHLGSVYIELGDFEHAKDLLDHALEIYKKHFSENHVKIGWVTSLLGDMYKNIGDYDVAKKLLEQSLIIYEKNYSKDHTEVGVILRNLGEIYLIKGQLKTGENYIYRSLDIFQKNNHPKSYTSLYILTDHYLKKSLSAAREGDAEKSQDLKEKAIDYLSQAQEIVEDYFPVTSSHVKKIQFKLKEIEH